MIKTFKNRVDLLIVQRYALASLLATALILIHYTVNTLRGSSENLGLEMQAFSIAVMGVIVVTSVMGLVFHQLKLEKRKRNSYALVLASGATKLVATIVAFQFITAL